MRNHELVAMLKEYGTASANAAAMVTEKAGTARLNFMASVLLESADRIMQLQDRLVKQAFVYEHGEAANARRWPLLEDDDTDAGAAL
jgi:hypothetical protein